MRTIYCPVCASEIEQSGDRFKCWRNGLLPPPLGHQIWRAIYDVDPPVEPPRKPELAEYLWCPNCTAPLEEHDDRQRRYQCQRCKFKLRIEAYPELMEVRNSHLAQDAAGDLFPNYDE